MPNMIDTSRNSITNIVSSFPCENKSCGKCLEQDRVGTSDYFTILLTLVMYTNLQRMIILFSFRNLMKPSVIILKIPRFELLVTVLTHLPITLNNNCLLGNVENE